MIVYLDSSYIVCGYLADEADHVQVRQLLRNPDHTTITGSWSRIEVTGALIRAATAHRGDREALLAAFEEDVSEVSGTLTVVDAEQAEIERIALDLVRTSGIRSTDAWHLACAHLALDELGEPGEERGFATRDAAQAAVARDLGLLVL